MTDDVKVVVVDDHDDPDVFLMTGASHYAVKHVYVKNGTTVVVLDFHHLFQVMGGYVRAAARQKAMSAPCEVCKHTDVGHAERGGCRVELLPGQPCACRMPPS